MALLALLFPNRDGKRIYPNDLNFYKVGTCKILSAANPEPLAFYTNLHFLCFLLRYGLIDADH